MNFLSLLGRYQHYDYLFIYNASLYRVIKKLFSPPLPKQGKNLATGKNALFARNYPCWLCVFLHFTFTIICIPQLVQGQPHLTIPSVCPSWHPLFNYMVWTEECEEEEGVSIEVDHFVGKNGSVGIANLLSLTIFVPKHISCWQWSQSCSSPITMHIF